MVRRRRGLASRLISAAITAGLAQDEARGGITLPEVRLWLGGERNQTLRESVVLEVRSAALRCDVVATGEMVIPRMVRQPRTLHLRPAVLELPPMRKESLELGIPLRARRMAARALKRGEHVVAIIEVQANDSRGSSAHAERRISLTLPPT